jgi:hypothetical protein
LTPAEKALLKVEELCTEVFGRGAAVSVDPEEDRWVVRCWDKKGLLVEETGARRSKASAVDAMLMSLRLKKASLPIPGACSPWGND